MPEMEEVYLLLGTNMGNKFVQLDKARSRLKYYFNNIKIVSSIYETAAWGKENQPSFLNQVLVISTNTEPLEFLKIILNIEKELGRIRKVKWGERLIDIDILYFGNRIVDLPGLIVPHPELHNRRFTLLPLLEIAPYYIHPLLKKSTTELLDKCKDMLPVIKLTEF